MDCAGKAQRRRRFRTWHDGDWLVAVADRCVTFAPCESGVALRLPPQSMMPPRLPNLTRTPHVSWTAPAACRVEASRRPERSGDGAFGRSEGRDGLAAVRNRYVSFATCESGVALRFPPQSKGRHSGPAVAANAVPSGAVTEQ